MRTILRAVAGNARARALRSLVMEASHAIAFRIVVRHSRMQLCGFRSGRAVPCERPREPVAWRGTSTPASPGVTADGRDVLHKPSAACCSAVIR